MGTAKHLTNWKASKGTFLSDRNISSLEPIRCFVQSPGADMRPREVLGVLDSAAVAWPLVARAQQPVAMPVIGYLGAESPAVFASREWGGHSYLPTPEPVRFGGSKNCRCKLRATRCAMPGPS